MAVKVEGLQAAGQAAVLLLPVSSLFASADVLYLLPLRDKVHHERSNPLHRTAHRSRLLSAHTHCRRTTCLATSRLTAAISRVLQHFRDEHGSIGIGNGPRILSAGACARDVYVYSIILQLQPANLTEKISLNLLVTSQNASQNTIFRRCAA